MLQEVAADAVLWAAGSSPSTKRTARDGFPFSLNEVGAVLTVCARRGSAYDGLGTDCCCIVKLASRRACTKLQLA